MTMLQLPLQPIYPIQREHVLSHRSKATYQVLLPWIHDGFIPKLLDSDKYTHSVADLFDSHLL